MKRLLLIGLGTMALAGCSRQEARDYAASDNAVVADTAGFAARAPGIDVTAAPGVAFSYRNGFRLPPAAIAGVQEAHAKACEQLGLPRCRITGMRYRVLGENNIEAELVLKLVPDAARAFTRDATATVQHADGTLIDAEITGTDANAVIAQTSTLRARAADELKRLDTAIAVARTGSERTELQTQRADIARQIAAATDTAGEARASLATTPVSFRYESGPAVRGFDTSAPFTSAINTGIASVETTMAVVLAILAIFGPPALVVGLALWAVLTVRRRLRARRPAAPLDGQPADVTL